MIRTLLLAAALLSIACGTTPTSRADAAPPSEVELAMSRAENAFKQRDWEEAQRIYEHIRVKYPFLDASARAELRLADMMFEQEEWADARDRYQAFAKLHPGHPEVDYAAMRAALTHYKEIPSDWFIFPPEYEKDQTAANNSLRALGDFLRQYPDSRHRPVIQTAWEDTRRKLAQHELAVAEFYARRNKWGAVVERMKVVIDKYPGTPLDEEAYFKLHAAYLQLKDDAAAKAVLDQVLEKLPNTPAAERAKKLKGG